MCERELGKPPMIGMDQRKAGHEDEVRITHGALGLAPDVGIGRATGVLVVAVGQPPWRRAERLAGPAILLPARARRLPSRSEAALSIPRTRLGLAVGIVREDSQDLHRHTRTGLSVDKGPD